MMTVPLIPVEACITAHGHRFGDRFYADDDDRTWRLVGAGLWRLIEDPEWWTPTGTGDV